MNKYLIDASVIHGWANTKDQHHTVCKQFIENHINEELYFPIHSLFEIHASCLRRKKGGTFTGLLGKFVLKNQKFISINRKFYDKCQNLKLFSLFKDLKGSDLIYACIARLGKLTLVTCNSDFDVYTKEIRVLTLK
ncbi:type II toxin-antitoxin system VapC family toxin [Patescibacteria group bacterium]